MSVSPTKSVTTWHPVSAWGVWRPLAQTACPMWSRRPSATTSTTTPSTSVATIAPRARKYRDVLRHPKVAFVIDDLASVSPWRVRGIEIRGQAEVLDTGGTELGPGFAPEMFRIAPQRIVSWGLGGPTWFNARSVP